MPNSPFTVTTPDVQEDRTAAIVSYLTIIGFIVAIVIHSSKKTALGAFHLRQVLGFIVIGLVAGVAGGIGAAVFAVIPVLGPILVFLIWAALWVGGLLLWLIGLLSAIQGKRTPVPVVGEPIQRWFANTFTY